MGDDDRDVISSSRRETVKLLGLGTLLPLAGATGASQSSIVTADAGPTSSEPTRTSLEGVIVAEEETIPIGPGAELTTFSHIHADGWVAGQLLELDLGVDGLSTNLLSPGITETAPVSGMVTDAGAAGGVNGDFFHLGGTNAPLGAELADGAIRKQSEHVIDTTFAVDANDRAHILDVMLDGRVTLPNEEVELDGLNAIDLPTNGLGAYTHAWGETTRGYAVGSSSDVTEVTVRAGEVQSTSGAVDGEGAAALDEVVLLGRDGSATTLGALSVGDPVSVEYAPSTNLDTALDHGLGGNVPLVTNGTTNAGLTNTGEAPRTAIGVSDSGQSVLMLTVDGRQRASRGLSYPELAEYILSFGAVDALNLDGGGSTTMVARQRGQDRQVQNNPSDGSERAVTNGVGVFFEHGTGQLTGFDLVGRRTDHPPRVFPELTRDFTANGYDEAGDPVPDEPDTWDVSPVSNASIDTQGVLTGTAPGHITVSAERNGITGEIDAVVVDDLVHLVPRPRHLALAGDGDTDTFSLGGRDEDGRRAPIEPRDVTVSTDESVVTVEATNAGSFEVTAVTAEGTATIELDVSGVTAEIPVDVGSTASTLSDFENAAEWELDKSPSGIGASLTFESGRDGQVLRLDYDFTTTDGTRAAYAVATESFDLPEGSERLELWVDGDSQGAWLRGRVRDDGGTPHAIDFAEVVDWDGWQHAQATLPSDVPYPLTVERIYAVEIQDAQQYQGSLRFDDLSVVAPGAIDPPQPTKPPDRLIVQHGDLPPDGELSFRFAALAGGTITTADGLDEDLARRALGEVAAAEPDLLVIGGNFAQNGTEDTLQHAMDVIESELGGTVPVHYVPGTAEADSDVNQSTFADVVGDPWTTFDHAGTRFIRLNSAPGSFRRGAFDQLTALDTALESAVADSGIDRVIVVAHHALTEPFALGSRLDDEREVPFVQSRLADLALDTDMEVTYLSGRGDTVSVAREDGVTHVSLGTIDADIEAVRTQGDARGWLEFGAPAGDELRAAFRPLLSGITLGFPSEIALGDTVPINATGQQEGAGDVELVYPVTTQWSASETVFVGSGDEAQTARESGNYDAILDPETRQLEGLSDARVRVRVTANDVTTSAIVTIGNPPEPTVGDYANEDDIVETDGLREAVGDWRTGWIDTDLLREVVSAWRSGEAVQ